MRRLTSSCFAWVGMATICIVMGSIDRQTALGQPPTGAEAKGTSGLDSLARRMFEDAKKKLIKEGIKKLTSDEKLRYAIEAVVTQASKRNIILKLLFDFSDPGEDDKAIAASKSPAIRATKVTPASLITFKILVEAIKTTAIAQ